MALSRPTSRSASRTVSRRESPAKSSHKASPEQPLTGSQCWSSDGRPSLSQREVSFSQSLGAMLQSNVEPSTPPPERGSLSELLKPGRGTVFSILCQTSSCAYLHIHIIHTVQGCFIAVIPSFFPSVHAQSCPLLPLSCPSLLPAKLSIPLQYPTITDPWHVSIWFPSSVPLALKQRCSLPCFYSCLCFCCRPKAS